MAVPAYKRSENDMTIINLSQDLIKEAIRLAKNEKVLPKKTEKILKETFLKDAINIYKLINAANELRIDDLVEAKIRTNLQVQAKITISNLYSQIKINIDYIETAYGKYENLIKILKQVKLLLNKWIKSDKDRN